MHKLDVYFLGQFKIVLNNEKVMSYEDIGSLKNAKLLAYLLKNYRVKLSSQEILTVMFPDDSSSNPANALKALVYRLRTTLKKYFDDVSLVVSGNSTYFINPDIEVRLDIDIFDSLINEAEDEMDLSQRDILFEQALNCYQGSFLPMLSEEQWVMITSTYLESEYLTAVTYLLKEYLKNKKYDLIEKLSTEALNYDGLNENLHYYLLRSLVSQNKIAIAKQHYLAIEKFLYDELGINPNEELQELYSEIITSQRVKEVTFGEIQQNLIEEDISGAFQCSYETFKKIYQLEVRKAMRRGFSEYIVLLTIDVKEHLKRNKEIIEAIIESTSSLLNQTILSTLRVGDTFTKYSNYQYLILLPDCTDENARRVVERIVKNFYQADKYQRITINSKIDEIKLLEGEINGKAACIK
ncbi:BTAD domain-containing putative transcriptional regulator [Thomasclavelia sp.]|uniref:BTAD domain-containing putative transcriptional regulator n=1 Tax=Thomasclavelia sp. TaxID=3025757 RepID=UPI0025F5F116|nr:BTAD domain-containing putative transcriptional regulator [Thomasclavelia sp.]